MRERPPATGKTTVTLKASIVTHGGAARPTADEVAQTTEEALREGFDCDDHEVEDVTVAGEEQRAL